MKRRYFLPLLALALLTSAGCKKNDTVFCSEMIDSKFKVVACHHPDSILINAYIKKVTWRKNMSWRIDTNDGTSIMTDIDSGKKQINPIHENLKKLKKNKKRYAKALEDKKKREKNTLKIKIKPKKNTISSLKNCKMYELVPSKDVKNPLQLYKSICVSKSTTKKIKAYFKLVDAVLKVNKKIYPFELSGLPLVNTQLPLRVDGGWIHTNYLPKAFVVVSKDPGFESVRVIRFKYYFR